ncbi:hypothetical protein D9M72_618840 [compost metagenome]
MQHGSLAALAVDVVDRTQQARNGGQVRDEALWHDVADSVGGDIDLLVEHHPLTGFVGAEVQLAQEAHGQNAAIRSPRISEYSRMAPS